MENTIDLVKFRTELKNGTFKTYVKRNKVYIEDTQTGEYIMICDLSEQDESKGVW